MLDYGLERFAPSIRSASVDTSVTGARRMPRISDIGTENGERKTKKRHFCLAEFSRQLDVQYAMEDSSSQNCANGVANAEPYRLITRTIRDHYR
jgi:hypothetical protein